MHANNLIISPEDDRHRIIYPLRFNLAHLGSFIKSSSILELSVAITLVAFSKHFILVDLSNEVLDASVTSISYAEKAHDDHNAPVKNTHRLEAEVTLLNQVVTRLEGQVEAECGDDVS